MFYLSDLCIPATTISDRQHLRSAATGTLLVPGVRSATGQWSFVVNGPATQNRLPPALRSPDLSESAFKRALFSTARRHWDIFTILALDINIQTCLLTYCLCVAEVGVSSPELYRANASQLSRLSSTTESTKLVVRNNPATPVNVQCEPTAPCSLHSVQGVAQSVFSSNSVQSVSVCVQFTWRARCVSVCVQFKQRARCVFT